MMTEKSKKQRKNKVSERRILIHMSMAWETGCNFFFYINFDDYCIIGEPGLGTEKHSHHSTLNKTTGDMRKNVLQDDDGEDFVNNSMSDGEFQDAQIQNIVFNRTEKLIPWFTNKANYQIWRENYYKWFWYFWS